MAHAIDAAIAELAATQHSAFSSDQARRAGISRGALRRRVDAGALLVPRPNVFVVAGAQQTWHTHVSVALLWAGDGAVASHTTAAELHQIDGIRSRDPIHITVPRGRYPSGEGIVTHRSYLLGPADVTNVKGIAATTPSRVLIDSGLVVPKLALEAGLEDVIRRGLASQDWLLRRLERLGGPSRPGAKPLVRLLLERDPSWAPLESVLELGWWDAIRSSGMRLPIRQHVEIVDGEKFRIDMAYLPERVAVEPSGFRWHSGRLKWGLDKRRERMLVSIGYRLFPVTWGDLQFSVRETLLHLERALAMAA